MAIPIIFGAAVDELDDLVIPDATFFVASAEWDFWNGENATRGLPAERAGFVTGARRNYAAIKEKVKMVKSGDEIVAGLRVIDTPGHTQGHVSLELAGGDGLDRGRRRAHSPADFVPASGMEAHRRSRAGSGDSDASQAIGPACQ